jgi:nitrite reductase/ring-hydroxylating ferredoxin subunit
MLKKIAIIVSTLTLMLIAVACASSATAPAATGTQPSSSPTSTPATPETVQKPAQQPSGPIKAVWIEPQVNGSTLSIQQSEVEKNWNVHFKANIQDRTESFMAYLLGDKIYVRANVCPPCRSIGYSLDGDILVCDRCATLFQAKTGDGIKGACVDYPKALVPYEIVNGEVIMKQADLAVAYENTLKPGWP